MLIGHEAALQPHKLLEIVRRTSDGCCNIQIVLFCKLPARTTLQTSSLFHTCLPVPGFPPSTQHAWVPSHCHHLLTSTSATHTHTHTHPMHQDVGHRREPVRTTRLGELAPFETSDIRVLRDTSTPSWETTATMSMSHCHDLPRPELPDCRDYS